MIKKFIVGTLAAFVLLVGVTAFAAYDFGPSTLKVGSSGVYVKTLQTYLGAASDGAFGPMTAAKVKAWQANNGLTADGLFGAMSKAKANASAEVFPAGCTNASGFSTITGTSCASVVANTFTPAGCTSASGFSPVTGGACVAVNANTFPAGCTSAAGFSPTTGVSCGGTTPVVVTGPLAGGAGSITTTETSTDVNNYLVEGQSDVKVLGFKVQASDSDAKVSNLKVTLTHSVSGSTYLDRYVGDVAIWMNGVKVGSATAAEFNKDLTGVYSKSITLNNAIVRMGTANKATFYVTLSGVSNIDTADMSAKWNVAVSDFRYQDGTGIVMSYSPVTTDNLLTVNDINSTGDVTLVMTKDSSSPDVQNVKVSSTSSTSDILMLAMKAKNTGADMTVDSMTFSVTTTTSPVAMIGELVLKANGATIATWSPASSNTSNFSATAIAFDLDSTFTLPSGSTTLFTVLAKINDIDNFTSGALTVSYGAAAKTATAFEVASTRTELTETGEAAGAAQTFFANGIVASGFTYGTPTVVTSQTGVTTSASYPITFKVSASGSSYYVKKVGGLSALTTQGATVSFADLSATGATLSGTGWLVSDGDTATFTTTGAIPGTATAGFAKIGLSTLLYGTASDSQATSYTFSPATSFETSSTLFVD